MLKKGMYYICSPLSASTKEEIQKNMLQARHYMESIIYFYRENRRGFYISTYRKQERKNEMQI